MWLFKKPTPDDLKNNAYLIYSEWGPDLRIPREERLAKQFPHIPEDLRQAWIEEFKRIDREIWEVAEEEGPKVHTSGSCRKRLKKAFPFMNRAALNRACFLAEYYAFHEGYDR